MLLVNYNCKYIFFNLFYTFLLYSIANTEQFKDLKKTFFDMEWKELNNAENNLEEKKNKLSALEE